MSKKEKLCDLQDMMCLETGEWRDGQWGREQTRCYREVCMKRLRAAERACTACEGLNVSGITECCPGWGSTMSRVMFVGQSAHRLAMRCDVPFILESGLYVDAALALSGMRREDCFWTNVVHCHPEKNRASTEQEKENCKTWLKMEVEIVRPKLVVALGRDAKEALDVVCD